MRRTATAVAGLLALALAVVPAAADSHDDAKFKVTGDVRARGEFVSNYQDFNDDGVNVFGNDDDFDFFPYRARIGAHGMFTENVHGFIELQNAGAWGLSSEQRDVLFSNNDDIDLYQAWLKLTSVNGSNVDITIGRSELVYDREFLLGDLDFYNGVSHDGVNVRWNWDDSNLDVFWYRLAEGFENDADTDFIGVHYSNNNDWIEQGDVSFYGYFLRQDMVSGIDRVDLFTLGGRTGRDLRGEDGFLWNAELAAQFGTVGNATFNPVMAGEDMDIVAFGGEGLFGYNWGDGDKDHRVYGRVYYGSGDDDATDDEVGSFSPLFQDFHTRLGIADVVHNSNVFSLSVAYNMLAGKHELLLELFQFLINEAETDATFIGSFDGIPGRFDLVFANGVDEDDLGQEFDVVYDYNMNKFVSFGAGLGYFLPGDAVALATGGFDDPVIRLYGQARLKF